MSGWRRVVFGRVMPVLRRFRLELLAGAVVVSVGLGGWGFDLAAQTGGAPGQSIRSSLYDAIGLFTLETGSVAGPVPWQLDVARFLAPATALAAAIGALVALFDQQFQRLVARYVVRDHVIVVGLNPPGVQVAREFVRSGQRVTLAGLGDDAHPDRARLRRLGVPTITSDGTSVRLLDHGDLVELLTDAGIRRARAVIIMTGDDETNAQLSTAAMAARRSMMPVYLEIDDLEALRAMGTRTPGDDRDVETYSVAERSARALVDQVDQRLGHGGRSPRVAVVGSSAFADHVALHLIRSWALDRSRAAERPDRPTLVVAGRGDESLEQTVEQFATWDPRAAGPEAVCRWERADDPGAVDLAVIACDHDVDTLAATLAWTDAHAGIVIACPERPGGVVELSLGLSAPDAAVFGRQHALLAPEYMLRGFAEDLAMGLHWSYRRHRRVDTPTNIAWHLLGDDERELNRSVARRLLAGLRDAGITVRGLQSIGAARIALPDPVVDSLARAYHEAWSNERVRAGWRHGEVRDDDRRVHPQLVGWDELSADDRAFNLVQAAELPHVLALLGRELVLRGE